MSARTARSYVPRMTDTEQGPTADTDDARRAHRFLTAGVTVALNVHRSTLVYRQRRIRELLGHDLRDPEKRFAITVALRMLERMEGPDRHDGRPPRRPGDPLPNPDHPLGAAM